MSRQEEWTPLSKGEVKTLRSLNPDRSPGLVSDQLDRGSD